MSKVKKFEIGDRVLTIIDNEVRKGTITRLALELPNPMAIIDFDDLGTRKAYVYDIIPEPKEVKEEPENVQDEREPVENQSITITRKDFIKAVAQAVTPTELLKLNNADALDPEELLILSMSGLVVGKSLENILFGEKKRK